MITHDSRRHIIVNSLPAGTTFNIFFGVATDDNKQKIQSTPLEKPADINKHIMVVDDENSIAKSTGTVYPMWLQCQHVY